MLNKAGRFDIKASFTNGSSLLDFLLANPVDMVLLDIALPGVNGMDLCQDIKLIAIHTIVLAFSNHSERSAVMKMLDNGASGYILKSASPDEIISCIDEAFEGKLVFSEEIQRIITAAEAATTIKQPLRLTAREKEILKLIATGTTTLQIAKTLFLSKFTVENHRKNILQKLQVKNVAELIAEAARHGWID